MRLGPGPSDVDPASLLALRQVLMPVLPAGTRTVEQYLQPPTDPYTLPPIEYQL